MHTGTGRYRYKFAKLSFLIPGTSTCIVALEQKFNYGQDL